MLVKDPNPTQVKYVTILASHEGQRLDNFLMTFLKSVPKSHLYRIIRKGEVRVNKRRVCINYRLVRDDSIRIPPVRVSQEKPKPMLPDHLKTKLEDCVLYEDEGLIVLNKPAGFAVHGGSGVSWGIIEALRASRPNQSFLELVHRLDRDTSGCLMIAKKRSRLVYLHECLKQGLIHKRYWALVEGKWKGGKLIDAPLYKYVLASGERRVRVSTEGKFAKTGIKILESFTSSTLIEAIPFTGRTHQIRVHCAWAGTPIMGDEKYGEEGEGLFLHAKALEIPLEGKADRLVFDAPLSQQFENYLAKLRKED